MAMNQAGGDMGRLRLAFLGTSGAIQVPSFHCSCAVCEAARAEPRQRRTRASVALVGRETVLIDAGPDLEFQLEREAIRRVDRIFVTHWHFDHIGGLGALAEPSSHEPWPPIEIYLPRQDVHHFEQELAYMKPRVRLHPLAPGDRVELPDASWEAVKTTHSDDSIGYIVQAGQRFAYLVDGVTPPPETLARLEGLDLAILEATMDELDEHWLNFTLEQAAACWRQIGCPRCILTHLSCHRWRNRRLVAGLSDEARRAYEARTPGLTFAYDGMAVHV